MAVIYQITNMANGKYYIGSAESFARREWQHKNDLRKGTHKNPRLQAAWNKYGDGMFVFEILEEVPEGESAFDWENKYLHVHVGLPNCYNVNTDAIGMRTGVPHRQDSKAKISKKVQAALAEGRGGKFIPSEETKRKMSEALKGNQCAKGYKRTPEEIEAIRERAKGNQNWLGRTHSDETKAKLSRPVTGIKPDGTLVEFVGLSAVKNEFGVDIPTIIRACRTGKAIRNGAMAGWVLSYKDAEAPNTAPTVPDEFAHLPRTRQLAKQANSKFYFTGEPCARGHVAPRKTKGSCTVCDKEDYKQGYAKRSEKPKSEAAKAAAKRYYEKNREKVIARAVARSVATT